MIWLVQVSIDHLKAKQSCADLLLMVNKYTVKPRYNEIGKFGNLHRYIKILFYWNSIFYANKFFLHGRSHKIFRIIGRSEKTNLNKEKKTFCWIWEPAMKDTVQCRPHLHIAFASTPPQQLIVSPALGRCHHEKRWQHEVNASSASCFMHLKNLRLPTLQH